MEKFDFDKARPADAAPTPKYVAEDWARAQEAINRELVRTQGLAIAGKIIGDIASLEQSAQEAQARAANANAQADSITTELAGMRAELERRRAEADAEIEGRKDAAAATAEQALTLTQKQCEEMVAKATAASVDITKEAKATAFFAQQQAGEAVTQRDAMRTEVDGLTRQSKELSEQLAELQNKIAVAQEHARRILGT